MNVDQAKEFLVIVIEGSRLCPRWWRCDDKSDDDNDGDDDDDEGDDNDGDYQAKETLVIEKDPVFVPVESWLANPQVHNHMMFILISNPLVLFFGFLNV